MKRTNKKWLWLIEQCTGNMEWSEARILCRRDGATGKFGFMGSANAGHPNFQYSQLPNSDSKSFLRAVCSWWNKLYSANINIDAMITVRACKQFGKINRAYSPFATKADNRFLISLGLFNKDMTFAEMRKLFPTAKFMPITIVEQQSTGSTTMRSVLFYILEKFYYDFYWGFLDPKFCENGFSYSGKNKSFAIKNINTNKENGIQKWIHINSDNLLNNVKAAKTEDSVRNYSVYMFNFNLINKRYIGHTNQTKLNKRWNNGDGYKYNQELYNTIKSYGWDNVEKTVISNNLTKEEAIKLEQSLIELYNTQNPKYGFNKIAAKSVA